MNSPFRNMRLIVCIAAALSAAAGAALVRAQGLQTTQEPSAAEWREASLDEYRSHLEQLETLTAACAKMRDHAACDPALVGPDESVPWGSKGARRLVRFGWLRVLFARASQADAAARAQGVPEKAMPAYPHSDVRTTSQLLADAQARLARDLAEAGAGPAGATAHEAERAVLAQVLAGREFRRLKQPDQGETALEKFSNWLNGVFEWLGRQQVRAAWIGRLLIWGFLLAVGVGLGWALLQMERHWRISLVPESEATAPGAASARDWQMWLKDAREAAARHAWREAIHFLYWAAIARLEGKKLWPADRARTPREYLAMVAGDDRRKAGLGALTREFEWTWYGGRYAGEAEYQRAEELAASLLEANAAQSGGKTR